MKSIELNFNFDLNFSQVGLPVIGQIVLQFPAEMKVLVMMKAKDQEILNLDNAQEYCLEMFIVNKFLEWVYLRL